MVIRSTKQSTRNGEVSFSALVELGLSAFVFLYLWARYEDFWAFTLGLLLASPFLLLRSTKSVRYGVKLFTRTLDGFGQDQNTPWVSQRGSPRFWITILVAIVMGGGAFYFLALFGRVLIGASPAVGWKIGWVCMASVGSWFAGAVLASAFTVGAVGFVRGPFGGKPALIVIALASSIAAPIAALLFYGDTIVVLIACIAVGIPTLWVSITNVARNAALGAAGTANHPGARAALSSDKSETWVTILAALPVILGMFIASYIIRVVATFRYLWSGILSLPANYYAALFVTDIFRSVELIPGYSGRGQVTGTLLWTRVWAADSSRIRRATALVELILLSVPVYFYRLALKATATVYWMVVGFRFVSLRVIRPDYERVLRRAELNAERGPIAVAVIVIVLLFLRKPSRFDEILSNPGVLKLIPLIDLPLLSPIAVCTYVCIAITLTIWWNSGRIANEYEHLKKFGLNLKWIQFKISMIALGFLARNLLLGFVFVMSVFPLAVPDHLLHSHLQSLVRWAYSPLGLRG